MGFGGKNWVSPSEAEVLKSVHLGCFTTSQLLSCRCSIYFSRLAYTCRALEVIPAPSRCLPSQRGQKSVETPVPLATGQHRGGMVSWRM